MSLTPRPPVDGGTVLVTGASSGIGRELAVQLAARAGTLILFALRANLLEQLRSGLLAKHPQLQVAVMRADLSDRADIDRVVGEVHEGIGSVDILVNNAGVGDQVLFDRSEWERTRQVLCTNVLAVAHLTALLVQTGSASACARTWRGPESSLPRCAPARWRVSSIRWQAASAGWRAGDARAGG